MSTIERAAHSSLRTRSGRDLSRLSQSTELVVAEKNAVADIECTTLDAIQQITGRAMQGVALVAQLEQQLSAIAPEAEGRLRAIADIHAVASAEVVSRVPRRLG